MNTQQSGYFIGLMSGTSLDGIDAALIDFCADSPQLLATHSIPLPSSLKRQLLSLCSPGDNEIERMSIADHQLGKLFAETCQQLLAISGVSADKVTAIGSHGQTIRHTPESDTPFTLQIGDPNLIAQQTGITTVADFRRRDMAAGGQGAPLTPVFHAAMFQSTTSNRALVNIGGMANLTLLTTDTSLPVFGFDTGPGNVLLDSWCQRHQQQSFDHKGQWARTGKVDTQMLRQMLTTSFFNTEPPKSTGRELFNQHWLDQQLVTIGRKISPANVATTLTELTATSISSELAKHFPHCQELYVCGGGAHNDLLMERLNALTAHGMAVSSTDKLGIAPDWIEAAAFAWLAKQTLARKPANLPSVTGANSACILGGIYYA
jgi:anhydro-N-acetylmuramic acid kinase